jgi:hypothetical protein
LPSLARIILDQVSEAEVNEAEAAAADISIEEDYKKEMY